MGYFVFLFCVDQICVVAPTKSFSCFSACILELYMDIGVLFINMMTYCSEGWREKNMRRIQSILPVWAPKGKEGRSYTPPPSLPYRYNKPTRLSRKKFDHKVGQ
jgi:hypothetical protein